MASNQIAFRSYYDDTGMFVWHTYSRVNKRAVFCIEPHCSEESCWLGGRCQSCEQAEESYLPSGHCEPTGEQAEESCSLSEGYEECLGCAGPSSPGANGYCAACWTQRYGCVEEPSPCVQCGETFDVGLAIDASRCPRCILSPCCAPQPAIECSTCGCTAEFRDGERVCWCDACQKDGCYYGEEDGCICCYQKDYVCISETDKACDEPDNPQQKKRCKDCGVERLDVEPVLLCDWFCRPCWQEHWQEHFSK